MKYARLSISDLKDLEKEFIEFLILNGIVAGDWEKIKKEEKNKAELIINQFSDTVWEGILRKTEMLELRRKDFLTLCYIKENTLYTLVIKSNDDTIDFTLDKDIDKVIADMDNHEVTVRQDIITRPTTEQLFDFIKVGFFITKNENYKNLIEARVS